MEIILTIFEDFVEIVLCLSADWCNVFLNIFFVYD